MKRTVIFIAAILLAVCAAAQGTPQERYIRRWAPTAVREMYRTGVPASITLAQGMLESRYGLSSLATEGNNHFGIKCHKDWTGKSMKYDDDAKGECFRVYGSAEESFSDHSDFLRYRDRYKFLFEYKTTDYKAWAYGLKKAGYATDPGYPAKLVKYIEDYKLYEYDTMTSEDAERLSESADSAGSAGSAGAAPAVTAGKESSRSYSEKTSSSSDSKASVKSVRKVRKAKKKRHSKEEQAADVIPASPLSIEEPKKIVNANEVFRFSLSREAYSRNGVPFITSLEGETYSSIAESNHLYLNELLKYNDLVASCELLPGTVVYLQPKKNQAEKGLEKYIVGDDSESLRDICQRFAVKMSSVLKMNGFSADYQPREGDTIILRGKKTGKR